MLGDIDILQGLESEDPVTYSVTVKCISQKGQFMYIKKEEFLKLQNQPHVWNILLQQVNYKQQQIKDVINQANMIRYVKNLLQ